MQQIFASLPPSALPPSSEKFSYSPDRFDLVSLGPDFSPEIERILKSVQEAQKADEKHFIKPQSLRDLFRHYSRGLPVIGSVEKATGKVAGLLLITPSADIHPYSPLAKYPTLTMEADTAIIGSIATTPGYKGQMKPLLAAAESHAASMGLQAVWAKVSIANEISGDRFETAGWERKIIGNDPDQGYKVGYWRKNLVGVAPVELPVFNEAHDEPAASNIHVFPAPDRR